MANGKTDFKTNPNEKKITVVRTYDGQLGELWDAWTKSEVLDKWWAPRPYRAVTKKMEFKDGGYWLYSMLSPDGVDSWCKETFGEINSQKSFRSTAAFCDVNGNENSDFPKMFWKNEFSGSGNTTTITNTITFDKREDMDAILKMGFEEGYKAGLNNLEEVLAAKV